MRTVKARIVQGQLFGSRVSAERFRVDEATGVVTRSVALRDPDALPVASDVGLWEPDMSPDDLRAVADFSYLRRPTAPPVLEHGQEVRVADLFSGCGAMSLGVAEACRAVGKRFVPAGAFDINRRILGVYAHNFGIERLEPTDLAEVLAADVDADPTPEERELKARLGRVDFAVAGPPCQGHSNLNNKTRRRDPKNALYFLVARFAKLFRPKWIIIENVIAVRHDKGDVVHRTQVALEKLGYETADGIVDLWSIGVPQTRRRHVLVAQLRDPGFDGPRILPYVGDLVAPYATRARNLRWAIEDLLNVTGDDFMDRVKVPDPITQSRIDYLFDRGLHDLPNSQRPDCHKSGEHSYGAVYGRMYWEEPAPTITGGFDTMGRGRFVHPRRRRTITAHEAARIQFIPDFFDFTPLSDARSTLAEAIGNAVPPKLSYVLALELMR